MKNATVAIFFFALLAGSTFGGRDLRAAARPDALRPVERTSPDGGDDPADKDQFRQVAESRLAQWDKTIEDLQNESLDLSDPKANFKRSVANSLTKMSLQIRYALDVMDRADDWSSQGQFVANKFVQMRNELRKFDDVNRRVAE